MVEKKNCERTTNMATHRKKFYVISFDLETTGRNVRIDTICEFGFAMYLFDFSIDAEKRTLLDLHVEELKPFHTYCKPSTAMHPEACEVHGLTEAFLSDKPLPNACFDRLQEHLDQTLSDPSIPRVLLAYNGRSFDLPLVVHEAHRHRSDVIHYFRCWKITMFIDVLLFNRQFLDPSKLLRKANGRCSYKLGDVYKALFAKTLVGAHGALEDSSAVVEIVKSEHCRDMFLKVLMAGEWDNGTGEDCCFNLMVEVRKIGQSGTSKRKRSTAEFFAKRPRLAATTAPSTTCLPLLRKEHDEDGQTKKKVDEPV